MTDQLRTCDKQKPQLQTSGYSAQSRYGIYFTPDPLSPIARIWGNWLSNSGELKEFTTQPQIYGFHATLKAPFTLKPEYQYADLREAVHHLVRDFETIPMPPMEIAWLGAFLALRPIQKCDAITRIADSCVRSLDCFRAPLTKIEQNKRLVEPLGHQELEFLERWGYPFVLEKFRFHFTLSNSIKHSDQHKKEKLFRSALWLHEQTAHAWPAFDALSIVEQISPDAKFVVRERVLLSIHQAHQ